MTIDSKLKFSAHLANICCKAHNTHNRANLILRCFMSKDISLLMTAFKVYVRPILEYCSVVRNPYLIKDIRAIEKVQKRFTKRIPGMKNATYCQSLTKLHMESLEVRRLRLDLLHAYKVLFGSVHVSTDDLLITSDDNSRRGHNFKLYMLSHIANQCASYSNRVIRVWNNLPGDKVDF